MNVIKKYNVGTASVDLPYVAYRHNIKLISFGGLAGRIDVGVVYMSALDSYFFESKTNMFSISKGFKLSIQKKILAITGNNSSKTYLIDGNGNIEYFHGVSKLDSNREMILNADGTKEIRDKNGIVEYYNSNGDITSIKQFTSPSTSYNLLTYTYSNNKLTLVQDRLGRRIVLGYNQNGLLSSISLVDAGGQNTKWSATLGYETITQGNVEEHILKTITKPNGVKIVYDFSNTGLFQVYTTANNGVYNQYCQKITCTKSGEPIQIIKYFGTRVAENTTFDMLNGSVEEIGESVGNFFEVKNNITGVRTRTQYKGLKAQFSYEAVGSESNENEMFNYVSDPIYNNFKCDVDVAKEHAFIGKVPTHYYLDSVRYAYTSGDSGAIYEVGNIPFISGRRNYYSISGWIKPTNIIAPQTIQIAPTASGGAFKEFNVNLGEYGTRWTFFHFDFYLDSSQGSTWCVRLQFPNNAKLGDVRLFAIVNDTVYLQGFLKKKVPNGTNEKVYLRDIAQCKYTRNGSTQTVDCTVTISDINNRLYNLAKDSTDTRLYYNDGESVLSGCSNIQFYVDSASTFVNLDDYYVGQESYIGTQGTESYVAYSLNNVFKTEYSTTTIGNLTSSKTTKYNYQGQVLEESDNGIVKTYTRNAYGLVTEEKTTGGAYKIIKTYVYDANADKLTSFTDEHGVTTTYVTDDFWGTIESSTCGTHTKTYTLDEYHTEIVNISQGTSPNQNVLTFTDEDWNTGGYSAQTITENSSLCSENRIVGGRLTRVGYGVGNTSFALSSMTYDDALNTETDAYSSRTKTFDAYDRLKSTKVGSDEELAIAYNVQGWNIEGRPGYGCDKISAIIDYKVSEKTNVVYGKDENDNYKETITYTTTNLTGSTTKKTTVVKKDTNNRPETETTTFVSADVNSSKFETVYKNDFAGDDRLAVLTHTVDNIQRTQSSIVYDTFRRPSSTSRNLTEYVFSRTFSYKTTGTRDFNRVSNVCESYNYSGVTYNLFNVNFDYDGEKIAKLKDANNSNAVISKYTYDALGRLVREDNATSISLSPMRTIQTARLRA